MINYEIQVPIRRPWLAFALCFLFFPFRPFLLVIFLMVRGIIRPQSPAEFLSCLILGIPFILIGLGFGVAVLRFILSNLLGQETLRVESDHLSIRQSLFGFGKWKIFPVEKISNLRTGWGSLEAEVARSTESVLMEHTLKAKRWLATMEDFFRRIGCLPGLMFRAENRTHFFGWSIDKSQASEIFARLKMHLPENAFEKLPGDES